MAERKNILLRLDPAVYEALAKWAGDELRSTTAQIEVLLRKALADAGRMPRNAGGLPRRGRPPKGDGSADPGDIGEAGEEAGEEAESDADA